MLTGDRLRQAIGSAAVAALLLGSCSGGTSEKQQVANDLLAEIEDRNPTVEFREITEGSRDTVFAIIEFPAGMKLGDDLAFPGDIMGTPSLAPQAQASPFGGVKSFPSRYSFSGEPGLGGGWTCGFSLAYNADDGAGEASVSCFQMR